MSSLDDARAALAEHDRPRCGWPIGCEPCPGAPAVPECPDCGEPYVDDGNGECAGCGWGPFVWCNLPAHHHDEEHACVMGGGASWEHLRAVLAEADRLTAELAARAPLPTEPGPSALAAFLTVLAIDNCPGDELGGGDCGPTPRPPEVLRTHPFEPHPHRGGCARCGEPIHHPIHRRTA